MSSTDASVATRRVPRVTFDLDRAMPPARARNPRRAADLLRRPDRHLRPGHRRRPSDGAHCTGHGPDLPVEPLHQLRGGRPRHAAGRAGRHAHDGVVVAVPARGPCRDRRGARSRSGRRAVHHPAVLQCATPDDHRRFARARSAPRWAGDPVAPRLGSGLPTPRTAPRGPAVRHGAHDRNSRLRRE